MRCRLSAAMLLGLALAACSHWSVSRWFSGDHTAGRNSAQAAERELFGSQWVVEEISGAEADSSVRSSFNVASDGRISGRGGCNSYFATGDFVSGLRIEGLGATRMACLKPLMSQETKFFDMLHRVRSFAIDENDGKLKLMDAAGAVLMVLRRA